MEARTAQLIRRSLCKEWRRSVCMQNGALELMFSLSKWKSIEKQLKQLQRRIDFTLSRRLKQKHLHRDLAAVYHEARMCLLELQEACAPIVDTTTNQWHTHRHGQKDKQARSGNTWRPASLGQGCSFPPGILGSTSL
jgi:hypothetical protein